MELAMSVYRRPFVCLAVACLSGCSGLTQVQDSLSKFDQGAHSVASSQMAFFNSVHTVECEKQFYDSAYHYSADRSLPIDLRGKCESSVLFLNSVQIETRQKLLTAITLYADQLQALASAGDDKDLDSNLQTAAGNLNKLASEAGLSSKDATIGHDVEAAVVGLTNMALDKEKASDIRAAAASQQDNLLRVASTLKAENLSVASVVNDDIGSIRANLAATLSATRNTQGSGVFFDVVRARQYLRTLAPFGSSGMDDSAGVADPNIDPASATAQLNAALDGLVQANHAIATAGNGGVGAAVSDLIARAQAAQAFQAALNK
jgi:hypothetical protein